MSTALEQSQPMQLASLRPLRGIDRSTFRARLNEESWRAALPESLSDTVLLQLARDLRRVEEYACNEEADVCLSSMASASLVVIGLLSKREPGKARVAMDVSQDGLLRAIQVYQWGLEREITSRIIGIQTSTGASKFVEHLERVATD